MKQFESWNEILHARHLSMPVTHQWSINLCESSNYSLSLIYHNRKFQIWCSPRGAHTWARTRSSSGIGQALEQWIEQSVVEALERSTSIEQSANHNIQYTTTTTPSPLTHPPQPCIARRERKQEGMKDRSERKVTSGEKERKTQANQQKQSAICWPCWAVRNAAH